MMMKIDVVKSGKVSLRALPKSKLTPFYACSSLSDFEKKKNWSDTNLFYLVICI